MKKYITVILVVSLLSQLYGCYSLQEISKEEMIQQVDKSKIKIWTKKNIYNLEESAYSIQNDSIVGRGKLEMMKEKAFDKKSILDFDVKIALSEVLRIEADKFSLILTLIAVGVPLALIIYAALNFEILGDEPLLGTGSF